MLVLEEGREFSLLKDEQEWHDTTPNPGAILEIYLPDTDYAPAPEVSVGLLVMGSTVGPDGSASVEVKYLGGGDPELKEEFSGLFNRRRGVVHLCPGNPCLTDEEFELHVTRYKIFSVEGFDRPYMTSRVVKQMNKWAGTVLGPADISRAKSRAKPGGAGGRPGSQIFPPRVRHQRRWPV